MNCSICAITNPKLKDKVEAMLVENDGELLDSNKKDLIELFPEERAIIENIRPGDCSIHFKFHQTVGRAPAPKSSDAKKPSSITAAIDKDEAQVIYEVLNEQAGTFNLITKKINDQLGDGTTVNPNLLTLYKETAESIRANVGTIKDLNASINGAADSALEGLKALAQAISGAPVADQSTSKFSSNGEKK